MFRRPLSIQIAARLREPRRFIQAVVGPRQTGKSTAVEQAVRSIRAPAIVAAADDPGTHDGTWISARWTEARALARARGRSVLVLDEVQKVSGWADVVKARWDEDSRSRTGVRVVLLGSAPLLLGRGLGESLAGRHEVIASTHWSWPELRKAFGYSLDEAIVFGGYPGAASLRSDGDRWRRYIIDSIVEATLLRDVLALVRVDKPALLRQLLHVAATSSGSTISYTKMLGQLQDAGNTTTLAHYLDLLAAAGLVRGIQKYAGNAIRQRASSPKLQVMNTALLSALSGHRPSEILDDPTRRGIWSEALVGSWLCAAERLESFSLWTWREGDLEVDFVVSMGDRLLAIEVKSGRPRGARAGLGEFCRRNPGATPLIVDTDGTHGVPIGEFVSKPVLRWLG